MEFRSFCRDGLFIRTWYALDFDLLHMKWQVLRQKAVSIKQDYSDVTSAVSYNLLSMCLPILQSAMHCIPEFNLSMEQIGIPKVKFVRLCDQDNQSISDVKDFVKKLNVLPEMTVSYHAIHFSLHKEMTCADEYRSYLWFVVNHEVRDVNMEEQFFWGVQSASSLFRFFQGFHLSWF